MYRCPLCEGEGEYQYDLNLEPATCHTCGGEGTVDSRVFCAKCDCHESQCECEEPDFYEDCTLRDIEEDDDEPEDDESDDTEDEEDTEEETDEEC